MGGGKGGGKTQAGWRHFAGAHMVLCHGPCDALYSIHVDDREAWCGVSTGGRIDIDKPDLFGGPEREGGIIGGLDVLMGDSSQGVNDYLQSLQSVAIPASRKVMSVALRAIEHGLNPYLRPWRFRVQRIETKSDGSTQWYPAKVWIVKGTVVDLDQTDVSEIGGPDSSNYPHTSNAVPFSTWVGRDEPAMLVDLFSLPGISSQADIDNMLAEGTFDATYRFDGYSNFEAIVGGGPALLQITQDIGVFRDDGSGAPDLVNPIYVRTVTGIATGDVDSTIRYSGSEGTLPGPGDGLRWIGVRCFDFPANQNVGFAPITSTTVQGVPRQTLTIEFAGVTYTATDHCQLPDTLPDMNAAHIIRECLTDHEWGLAQPENEIDDISFVAAADLFNAEGMGLSIKWEDDGPIEDFITLVGEHADAKIFPDRRTGKWKIKPIRADYDPDAIPHLTDADVIRWDKVERRDPAEGMNSVTVRFYDRRRASEAARSLQDISLVTEVGRVRAAEPFVYMGFSNEEIAARVCLRELNAATAPVATATITCTRAKADQLNPGDAFKLTSARPGLDFDGEIMRVDRIDDEGEFLKIEIVSDVFDLTDDTLIAAGENESTSETDRDAKPLNREVAEDATYWQNVSIQGHTITDVLLGQDPDRGLLALAASSENKGEANAQVWTDAGTGFVRSGSMNFSPSAVTVGAVLADPTETVIAIENGVRVDRVAIGSLARLGAELCRVDAISETEVTLGRGCLDTVPITHPAGTVVIFDDALDTLESEFTDAETIDARFLPVAYNGALSIAEATTLSTTFASRAIRPLPAGNVQIAGSFTPPAMALVGALPDITWSHRDRKSQTAAIFDDFTAGDIGPEAGVTYRLEVSYIDPLTGLPGAPVTSKAMTGTSYTLLAADFPTPLGGEFLASLSIRAERDGFDDRGGFAFTLNIPGTGITADRTSISADSTLYTADITI
ncbi:MAG: phage tail protein [Pseudomonadota bacterium]